MSIRVARNETSGMGSRVSPTRSRRAKVADSNGRRPPDGPVGRFANAVPDKRERQSRAISKRPITGERSELEEKKLHEKIGTASARGWGKGDGREQ